jgi:hypothetical protein
MSIKRDSAKLVELLGSILNCSMEEKCELLFGEVSNYNMVLVEELEAEYYS